MTALRCAALLVGCAVSAGIAMTLEDSPRASQQATARGERPMRSMWVWNSAEILPSRDRQDALLDFCRQHDITALWVQITTGPVSASPADRLTREVTNAPAWRALLTRAHERGIRVEALDGDPVYAMKAFHHIPVAIAEAVLAFNRSAGQTERFDGLHFDIEPYLLPAWHSRAARERLLHDYLTLTVEIQRRIDAAGAAMRSAIDIPFWWHHRDESTGEAIAAVTFGGRRQSASEHALAIVDRVVLMNYRNAAEGPDGLIAFARDLLEAAVRVSHATVSIGVETTVLSPQRVWFALGDGGTSVAEGTSDAAIPRDGARIFVFDDGRRLNAGVATGAAVELGGPLPPGLLALARAFGVRRSSARSAGVAEAAMALESDAEWQDARAAPIVDTTTGNVYEGIAATYVPSPKSTFATNPPALDGELIIAERAFGRHRQYGGIAIHDYEGYRALLTRMKTR